VDLSAKLLQLFASGIAIGSIYALVALGFNVIYKTTDAINFAQGEWVMVGGILAAALFGIGAHPFWLVLIGAVLLVGLLGIGSERLVIRPLRAASPMLVTLLTIGLAIATKSIVMLVFGKNPSFYPAFSGETPIRFGGASIHPQSLWIIGITAAVMVAMHLFFEKTLLGRALRAVAADRDAARLVGVNVSRMVMWSFGLAALVGAIAGVAITPLIFTDYNAGTMLGFKGFSAAMLGGIGSLYGAVLGGLLLGVAEALSGGLISSEFKDATAFCVLLLILFLRPAGLFRQASASRV
jgi:branched-chain amino acid transport system permease protein